MARGRANGRAAREKEEKTSSIRGKPNAWGAVGPQAVGGGRPFDDDKPSVGGPTPRRGRRFCCRRATRVPRCSRGHTTAKCRRAGSFASLLRCHVQGGASSVGGPRRRAIGGGWRAGFCPPSRRHVRGGTGPVLRSRWRRWRPPLPPPLPAASVATATLAAGAVVAAAEQVPPAPAPAHPPPRGAVGPWGYGGVVSAQPSKVRQRAPSRARWRLALHVRSRGWHTAGGATVTTRR